MSRTMGPLLSREWTRYASTDLFALNHDAYMRGKAISNDIGLLLRGASTHLLSERRVMQPHKWTGATGGDFALVQRLQ
jgi:hypothetical protein